MIVFFRGKAATGKTTIADLISYQKKFTVLSKDHIFDELLKQGVEWDMATSLAYDKLADTIQDYYEADLDVIVDIGLAHTPYFKGFLKKMTLDMQHIKLFLFVCENNKMWEERMAKRINSPESSNQSFKSIQEAIQHYEVYKIYRLPNEIEIDSAQPIESIVKKIYDEMRWYNE